MCINLKFAKKGGFSLFEVMLAMLLLSIVMMVCWQLVSRVALEYRATVKSERALNLLRSASLKISQGLSIEGYQRQASREFQQGQLKRVSQYGITGLSMRWNARPPVWLCTGKAIKGASCLWLAIVKLD
jgi:prepilin-type N-terminal cleavage/methylation domain-containing protein